MDEQIRQIAERLKGLRDALDMTEEEVAADCGLTVDEYRDLESGECDLSISILQRIAHKYTNSCSVRNRRWTRIS